MTSENTHDTSSEADVGSEPVVYAIGKTAEGWRSSRRDSLTAAGVAAATAAAAGGSGQPAGTPT